MATDGPAVRFGCSEQGSTISDNDENIAPVSANALPALSDNGASDCSTACTSDTEAVTPLQSRSQWSERSNCTKSGRKFPRVPPGQWHVRGTYSCPVDTKLAGDLPPGTPEPGTPEWTPRYSLDTAKLLAKTQQVSQAQLLQQATVLVPVPFAPSPSPSEMVQPLSPKHSGAETRAWYRVAYLGGIELRTQPSYLAPRTGVTLPQNEVFAVSHELAGTDGRIYLLLSDGRGWAFDDAALLPHDPSVVRGRWAAPSSIPSPAPQPPLLPPALQSVAEGYRASTHAEPLADGYRPPCMAVVSPHSQVLATAAPLALGHLAFAPPGNLHLSTSPVAQTLPAPQALPTPWDGQPPWDPTLASRMIPHQ